MRPLIPLLQQDLRPPHAAINDAPSFCKRHLDAPREWLLSGNRQHPKEIRTCLEFRGHGVMKTDNRFQELLDRLEGAETEQKS